MATAMGTANKNDLRIWWVSQSGTEVFDYYDVTSLEEAYRMLNLLAQYDLHLLKVGERKEYENSGGLEIFDGESWIDWNDQVELEDWHLAAMPSELVH